MQANWRFFQRSLDGAVIRRYSLDAEYAACCRLLAALAFVPPTDVVVEFDIAAEHVERNFSELTAYVEYFEATWVGLPNRGGAAGRRIARFPIEMWNIWDRTTEGHARTNNAIEGWHRGLESTLGMTRPTLWKFLDAMRIKFRYQQQELAQVAAGNYHHAQRAEWQRLTHRLQVICRRYNNPPSPVIEHLQSIAMNIGY
jgi:hypothetical protein